MSKTNLQNWSIYYNEVLLSSYQKFISKLDRDDAIPSFKTYVIYCYTNTKKYFCLHKRQWVAPIF